MRLFLIDYGYDFKASQEEKYDFVIKIANDEYRYSDIAGWIKGKTKK